MKIKILTTNLKLTLNIPNRFEYTFHISHIKVDIHQSQGWHSHALGLSLGN